MCLESLLVSYADIYPWSGYHALPTSKHVSENDMEESIEQPIIARLLHNAMAYLCLPAR